MCVGGRFTRRSVRPEHDDTTLRPELVVLDRHLGLRGVHLHARDLVGRDQRIQVRVRHLQVVHKNQRLTAGLTGTVTAGDLPGAPTAGTVKSNDQRIEPPDHSPEAGRVFFGKDCDTGDATQHVRRLACSHFLDVVTREKMPEVGRAAPVESGHPPGRERDDIRVHADIRKPDGSGP